MSAVMDAYAYRPRHDNRAFQAAVAVSLLFHATLLFTVLMKPSRAPATSPGPIVAHLVSRPQPAAAAPAPQPEPPKPQVEEPPPRPVEQPKPPPIAKAPSKVPAAPVEKPSAAPAPSPPVQAPAAPAAPSAPASPAAPAPLAKADPSPAPPSDSADAGSLELYRMQLMKSASRYKKYPRVAMDNNWEGRVLVRMVIGANGMISSLTVISSAGHEILDKQAIDMLQKAKPLVQIPPALRGREFTLEIPVIYSLKDAEAG
ncbi:MAG: energy transducer TonB [Betaproteobacteria bacterium]|nr:energy transducer TonB [Betaproteobacteria bacterium]